MPISIRHGCGGLRRVSRHFLQHADLHSNEWMKLPDLFLRLRALRIMHLLKKPIRGFFQEFKKQYGKGNGQSPAAGGSNRIATFPAAKHLYARVFMGKNILSLDSI